MRKYFFLLLIFSTLAQADSCVVNFSIAGYGTIYDQINYSFIPYSAVNPMTTGGGQFFLKINGIWVAATPVPWSNQVSITVSNTTDCDTFYQNGLSNAEVSYADITAGQSYNAPTPSNSYCLIGNIGAQPDSQTMTIPQFGPNNGFWKPCTGEMIE